MQMNNKNDNFFSENTFTYESGKNGITNELIESLCKYVTDRIEEIKYGVKIIDETPDFEAMKVYVSAEQSPIVDSFEEEKVNIENNDEENVETFDSIQEKCRLLSEGDIKTKNGVLKKYYGNNKYIIIPDNITGIERDSFEFADNLIGVIMHDSITNIGSYAFNGCKNLSAVILSKGITTLKVGTFSGCYSLANIMIPASVTYIEQDAFENCGKFIVHTVEGSYAEKFARENGIEVVLI